MSLKIPQNFKRLMTLKRFLAAARQNRAFPGTTSALSFREHQKRRFGTFTIYLPLRAHIIPLCQANRFIFVFERQHRRTFTIATSSSSRLLDRSSWLHHPTPITMALPSPLHTHQMRNFLNLQSDDNLICLQRLPSNAAKPPCSLPHLQPQPIHSDRPRSHPKTSPVQPPSRGLLV